MKKPYPVAERFAVSIYNYVRACHAVRIAASPAEEKAARLLRADRRKLVGNTEHTFQRFNGDRRELVAALEALLLPGGAR